MKKLSMFDLRFGFYIQKYPYAYGQSPRSKLAYPGPTIRTLIGYLYSLLQVNLSLITIS